MKRFYGIAAVYAALAAGLTPGAGMRRKLPNVNPLGFASPIDLGGHRKRRNKRDARRAHARCVAWRAA